MVTIFKEGKDHVVRVNGGFLMSMPCSKAYVIKELKKDYPNVYALYLSQNN